jgi:type II secretory pathway component HofQ
MARLNAPPFSPSAAIAWTIATTSQRLAGTRPGDEARLATSSRPARHLSPSVQIARPGSSLQASVVPGAESNFPPHTIQASLFPPTVAIEPEEVLCSAQVVQEDPAKVLQMLSMQTKINMILLSQPQQKLTLQLVKVPLAEMIRHICALTGLAHLKVGQTFVLATPELLKSNYPAEWAAAHPEPPPPPTTLPIATRIYRTSFVSSATIAQAIGKVFGEGVLTIVAGPATESPSIVNQNTSGATGASGVVITKDEGANTGGRTIVVRGPQDVVEQALALAAELDRPRPQVSIEVTIHDISDSALRELGLNWSYGTVTINETSPRGINFGSFTRTPLSFQAVIKALEKQDKAQLLASPNISVLDGERAFILIGDRINFPVLVGYTQANTPIFSREEQRVGIYLQVAVSVSADGTITLTLYPQVSTVTGYLEVNGASYPQISTREAQTTLRLKSDEMVIMGGLLKSEEVRQVEEVPILSKIPVLGELFRRRKSTKSASQVIISIKPKLIVSHEPR